MTVLAIAAFEVQAHKVEMLLSTALQSNDTSQGSSSSSSSSGSSVVPITVAAPIGICELLRQWREMLVADHRVVFSNQLTHTSKWLGEEMVSPAVSTNESNHDQPSSAVIDDETAIGIGTGTGTSPAPGPDIDTTTNTNRTPEIDLGFVIPSIRLVSSQPSQDN